MSSTLMWKPVRPEGESLSNETKRALSRLLWDTDGSCGDGPAIMDASHIEFLRGMAFVGSKEVKTDCDTLIAAIQKYGAVEVWHEY